MFPAFLDACVLAPYYQCDLLLRLARERTYIPLWSKGVLGELDRTLIRKLGVPEVDARRRIETMNSSFRFAEIEGYESLIESMQCDKKDRHVLAAAVRGGAGVIVTENLKDFPPASLEPYDMDLRHPDEFLLDQLDLYPERTQCAVLKQLASYRNPPLTPEDLISRLERQAPQFAAELRKLNLPQMAV